MHFVCICLFSVSFLLHFTKVSVHDNLEMKANVPSPQIQIKIFQSDHLIWTPTLPTCSFHAFPILVNGNPILPVFRPRCLVRVLMLVFLPYPTSDFSTNFISRTFNLYTEYNIHCCALGPSKPRRNISAELIF